MPCNLTNGSTSGNGVIRGSAPIMTSCNNRGILESGVFCGVRHEAISREPTGQASQLSVMSLQLAIEKQTGRRSIIT
jgi:hypothetical protein